MKRAFNRAIAMLLVLFIVFPMLPVSVLAEQSTTLQGVGSVHTVTFESDQPASYLVADGKSIETMPEAPEKTAADFIGWYDGETEITAPFTPQADMTIVPKYDAWDARTLDAQVDGATVTLSGVMPSDVSLTVTDHLAEQPVQLLKIAPKKSAGTAAAPLSVDEKVSLYSLDIGMQKNDATEYQPDAETPVRVTIAGEKIASAVSEGRVLNVTHTLDDGTAEQIADLTVQGETVSFSVIHFSTFDVDAVWNMTSVDTELMDGVSLSGTMPSGVRANAAPAEVEDALMAAELSFTNYDHDVQPAAWGGSMTVTMHSDAIAQAVHSGAEMKALRVSGDAAEELDIAVHDDGSVSFTADAHSVYAVTATTLNQTVTTSDGTTYDIEVTYTTAAGIPMEGTALRVEEVLPSDAAYASYLDASASRLGTDTDHIELSRMFDIHIVDAQDASKVYEPAGSVDVSIRLVGSSLDQYANVSVLHFAGTDAAEPEMATAQENLPDEIRPVVFEETVKFTTGSFSVFVVAGYTLEKTIEASDGNTYRITVEYDENCGIPDGADLVVTEMAAEDYAAYLTSAAQALGEDVHSVSYGKLFDISIEKDGVTYQPNEDVRVKVELLDAAESHDIRVVHFEDADTPKSVAASVEGQAVTFETNGFSVFSFLDFSLLDHIVTAVLGEKTGTLYENDDIILSGSMPALGTVEAKRVDFTVDGREALAAYDIKIYANSLMKSLGIAWQPSDKVQVTIKSDALNVERVDVYHQADEDAAAELIAEPELVSEDLAVEDHSVTFAASSFSVYVIIDHENGTVVTPRVEFHFINRYTDEQYSAGVTASTPASPYNFVNTNGDYQTTQILTDGETLELIANPDNVEVTTSSGSTIEKYFFGWYVVDMSSDSSHLDTNGKYSGSIAFTWPNNPQAIDFTQPISITAEDADGDGEITTADTLNWSINAVSGSGTMDSEATVHVYLAPIYEDFYFLNFHKGSKEDTTGLSNSLINRKLLVFGSGDSLNVRIGDVVCESPDSRHLIFAGWEEDFDEDGEYTYYRTVDMNGDEANSDGSTSGYYIVVPKRNGSHVTSLDLFPVFDEARWVYFNTGLSGSGASYVGASFRLTNDDRGTSDSPNYYFDNSFFADHLSRRPGYVFDGWYMFANQDPNTGKITNLNAAEDVTVSYIDSSGNQQTTTIHTEAIKIVDRDGSLVYNGVYQLNGKNLFEGESDRLRFYKTLDDMTLYANWIVQPASFRVIIWKQKVTDDKDATDEEKTYDYEIFYTSEEVDTTQTVNLTRFNGEYVDAEGNSHSVSNMNLLAQPFTGFHYARNDVEVVGNVNPDGTTVYNVYYDRNKHRLTFQVDDSHSGYNYTVTTSNTGTQYAFIHGEFVQLTYRNGTWYSPTYGEVYVQDDSNGTYGLVNGQYVELTSYVSGRTYSRTGYTYTKTTSNSGTQYGVVSGEIRRVYRSYGQWWDSNSWNSSEYYGDRYTLSNSNGNAYSGTLYKVISGTAGRGESGFEETSYTSGIELYGQAGNTFFQLEAHEVRSYTYVNSSGVTTPYTGAHRYTKSYGQTGELTEYTGTRYTRSGSTSGFYTVYIIEALYGQTISSYFPIPGYTNGERWKPQTNTQGWSEVMILVDIMPDEDITFRLNEANYTQKTMNYYVQALPGTTPEHTYGNIGYVLYNSVRAKYNFITSEDFLELTGFTKNGSNPTISGNTYLNDYNNTINFYYLRKQYDLTFDVNYPVDANITYSEGQSENLTASDIYYGANLQEYGPSAAGGVTNWYYGTVNDDNTAVHELKAPDHYIFGGWYEDQSCTVPFNFNGTMPAANKIVYAQWTPERFQIRINPDGGEIDHVNHGGYAGYGLSVDTSYEQYALGYNTSQSTYFNNDYGEPVSEYSIRRRFVAMSDAVAEEYEAAGYTVYYYMNYQWRSTDSTAGNDADLRSALYLTEQEVRDFYDLYRALTERRKAQNPERYQELRVLDYDTWRSLYVSSEKYRPLNTNESWTFLGWYKDGESMPYNFADPVSSSFTLTAHWRLDGGYQVQYIPQYTMPDGSDINGEMDSWRDPVESYLTYADNAATHIFKAPTGLTKDGIAIADDSVIFLGWALVSKTGTDENPVYTPLEVDADGNIDCYYNPGDPYTVSAVNAGTNSTVYMQAVYQYREASDRRPKVANLTLDANTGYVDDSMALPVWDVYPGVTAINTEDHLLNVDGSNEPTQIEFGDIQASAAVHLYQYATDAGVIASDGHNYFIHPNKYLLLGFDDEPTEGDFIATYAADSVIGVTRKDEKTIYAVWEPMVYMTFVNDTDNTVSFGLNAADHSALTVINVKEGLYERTALADYGEITLEAGESIQLAFPNGAEKQITVSGTNMLGTGKVLVWNSSLDLEENGETTSYDTSTTGNDITYSHNASSSDTHTLPTGFVNNTQTFTFNETLITNKNPIIVTFTERSNAYALVLDDNYPGGGKQEYDYSAEDIAPENGVAKTQVLPSTSTRIGYQFLGWATKPNASSVDYSASMPSGSPWTITDLNAIDGFFSHDTTTLESGTVARTLYAVWESKADAGIVYIYKEVPAPGNEDQDFTFTVKITGSHHVGDTRETIDESHSFILHHGWYLKISSSNENGTSATPAYVQSVVQVFDDHGVQQQESDATIRWEKNVTVSDRNGFDGNLQITVSEGKVTHYTSSITRNAHTYNGAGNPLYIGNSSDITTLPLTLEAEEVYWKNTDAGGTVVFTNQRQTYDITVSKTLVSNNNASRAFSYNAVYTDTYTSNGSQMTALKELDGFVVTSGSETILSDIPAGVSLTIRETADPDNNYIVAATSDEGATDADNSDNGFAFSVTKDDTITYTNTLKSYPVTFRLVDQDGNPLQAMFSLASTSGSLGTDLYAENAGVFYTSNTFWADTYTLNQTTTPEGYISIQGTPVTLTVTGNGITSNHSWVTAEEDKNGGYIVTVKNLAQKKITVKKVLIDPLLSNTRTFGFGYSYISPVDNNPVSGTFTVSPMANSTTGADHILTVPANVENLMITELTWDSYAAVPDIYTTTSEAYATDGSVIENAEGEENTYSFRLALVNNDATIRFTNSRKTQTVTVRKEVSDPDDIRSFTFTGTLLNGAHPIPNYLVYTDETDTGNDLETDASGSVSFELQHGESIPLIIPYGAKLVIEEEPVFGYAVSTSSNEYTDSDDEDNLFTIPTVETDGTVLFTNVKGARLTVQKNVSGAIGEQTRSFTFTLTSVEDEQPGASYLWIKGEESGTLTTEGGHNTFTLAHGESIVIILPLHKEVEITEENDIYTTTWTLGNEEGTTGSHKKMTLTEDCDLLVDNHLDPVAPTNYQTNIVPYLLMLAAGALLLLLRKKRAEEKGGGSFE